MIFLKLEIFKTKVVSIWYSDSPGTWLAFTHYLLLCIQLMVNIFSLTWMTDWTKLVTRRLWEQMQYHTLYI